MFDFDHSRDRCATHHIRVQQIKNLWKMRRLSLLFLLVQTASLAVALGAPDQDQRYVRQVKLHRNEQDVCTILSDSQIKKYGLLKDGEVISNIWPAVQPIGDSATPPQDKSSIIEIFGKNKDLIQAEIDAKCKFVEPLQPFVPTKGKRAPEVVKIVDGGENANRIDVVFMGDGYNASQRDQFFDDIRRLTTEMFEGDTFKSYLPLFNIWAIYDESVDSGIGYDGAKNTPFRLYRAAGQLRGIYTGNAAYARQVCQLTGAGGCDYPSLIGNDDFYGGLGGEFVISTKSTRTGTVVLRHEMGHNFVNVGEEYDNGSAYRGVNSATSITATAWASWLNGTRREERSMYRVLEYPWQDLSQGLWSTSFSSDGLYSRWEISLSVSAAGEEDCLEFTLDGQVLPWTTTGFDDREFYDWSASTGFTSGSHTFSVRSKTPSTHPDIPRMIASVRIHEFGSESEFEADINHVSFYPTWDVSRRKTFRPTNAGCLMRNMTYIHFCDVCKEGMWWQFLNRISLIDEVTVQTPVEGMRNATVHTLKLGQWRPPGNEVEGETLRIRWSRDSVDQWQYDDLLTAVNVGVGNWRVTVTLETPEVRSDPNGLLTDSETFTIIN